jgi:hypothetical protein
MGTSIKHLIEQVFGILNYFYDCKEVSSEKQEEVNALALEFLDKIKAILEKE